MGKRLLEQRQKIDRERLYHPREALELLKELEGPKFDESVEAHVNLNVDPRRADQMVRGTLMLPNGTGKTRRVAVFAAGEKAREAEEAGADIVGTDDLAARVRDEGFMDFEVAVATPDQMSIVGRLGQILGPRGLMPNPKSGTIVANPADLPRVIQEAKGGRIEFRNDRTGLLHVGVGKASFDEQQIRENVLALVDAVQRAKPTGAKGVYTRSITLTTTMGPGIRLDVAPTIAAAATS